MEGRNGSKGELVYFGIANQLKNVIKLDLHETNLLKFI